MIQEKKGINARKNTYNSFSMNIRCHFETDYQKSLTQPEQPRNTVLNTYVHSWQTKQEMVRISEFVDIRIILQLRLFISKCGSFPDILNMYKKLK